MFDTIKQAILILSLVLVAAYEADAQTPACHLVSAGFINGNYANIRIEQNQQIIGGAASLEAVLAEAADLEARNICKVALHHCELAIGGLISSGVWAKQRLLVNGQALFGAQDIGSLFAQLRTLKAQNICD